MEWTLDIPEELAACLRPMADRLEQVLECGLRTMEPVSGPYTGVADVPELLARLPAPEQVLALRPSPMLVRRIEALLQKNRAEGLTEAEEQEWQQYAWMEHLLRMAKAHALQKHQAA